MRLLVANHTAFVRGGAELYLQSIVPALEECGWEIRTLVEGDTKPEESNLAVGQRQIANARPGTVDRSVVLEPVRQWKPEVVMQNGLLDSRLEKELLGLAPSVLFAHGYYGTCISGLKRFASPSLQVCHRTFGPTCLALYYPRRCGGLNPLTAFRSYELQRSRNQLLGRYARICVASDALKREYLHNGVPERAVTVLPLFPDRVSPDPLPPGAGSTDGPILFVGRLTPQKGGALLLQAVVLAQRARGRSMHVQFVGEGQEQALLERLAARLGVRATFLGWCEARKRQEIMRSASLLAVPSTSPETFAIVGLEAACVGLPSVGFANGGVPEWLIDGHSGVSAEGERPRAENLASAIVRALEDPFRYAQLRRGAWQVSRRFSLHTHVTQLDTILRAVAVEPPGERAT